MENKTCLKPPTSEPNSGNTLGTIADPRVEELETWDVENTSTIPTILDILFYLFGALL